MAIADLFLSVGAIYFFVIVGYIAKTVFRDIHERSLVILSVYFLQPLLTFWGLSKDPINTHLGDVTLYYLVAVALTLLIGLVAVKVFSDQKEQSIVLASSLIGNTGNIGIPLGIALFGPDSVIYTTLLNLINVIVVQTLGVYLYSRGNLSWQKSLIEIMRMPVIWSAGAALLVNMAGLRPLDPLMSMLEMGAMSSMTLQLIIFGIYLRGVKLHEIKMTLIGVVTVAKFVVLPLIGFVMVAIWPIESYAAKLLLFELAMPVAVANVNLAALYHCKPYDVASVIMATSLLFLIWIWPLWLVIEGIGR